MTTRLLRISGLAMMAIAVSVSLAAAQTTAARQTSPKTSSSNTPKPSPTPVAPSYIVGPDDVLAVNVWNDKTISGDVIVRPDGKITLPVGNDIMASGLTVEQLKGKVVEELKRFYDQVDVFIQVKQINSRRVFIQGSVNKPGAYALTGPMTIVQLIATAGGLAEFADKKNITVIRTVDGQQQAYKINFDDLMKGKNLAKNNIELRPGDQIIVK